MSKLIETDEQVILDHPEYKNRILVAEVVYSALQKVYLGYHKLGKDGLVTERINILGDQAMRADVEAEERILDEFDQFAKKANYSFTYWTEECGQGSLGLAGGKPYFLVADGIDGSANYKDSYQSGKGGPYGTMVGIAQGENPKYKDFEVAGIMMPEEAWIILGVKGFGVSVYELERKKATKLQVFENQNYCPEKMLGNVSPEGEIIFPELPVNLIGECGSTAAAITALSIGENLKNLKYPQMNLGWQGLIETTRKNNLEQPIVRLLLTELGGSMNALVDDEFIPVEDQEFNSWAQEVDSRIPLISVINNQILKGIITGI